MPGGRLVPHPSTFPKSSLHPIRGECHCTGRAPGAPSATPSPTQSTCSGTKWWPFDGLTMKAIAVDDSNPDPIAPNLPAPNGQCKVGVDGAVASLDGMDIGISSDSHQRWSIMQSDAFLPPDRAICLVTNRVLVTGADGFIGSHLVES